MMNRSKIDWTDFSWNPITGCRHDCAYCYAAKQAKRFCGDVRLNKTSPQLQTQGDGLYILEQPFRNSADKVIPLPAGFEPTLHKYRLSMPAEKKLPANIFVGSMADVFGEWVPDEWIKAVFEACAAAPWHNYMFLTKNPGRYTELASKEILPKTPNIWLGSTVTTQEDMFWWSGYHYHNTFVSIEPLLAEFELPGSLKKKADWIIIGAETGNRKGKVAPERTWIENIVAACRATETPVFMKDNLASVWGAPLIQEYPAQLTTPSWEHRPVHKVFVESVRDKKKCQQCGTSVQGKPAWRISARFYICEGCYEGGV